MKVVINGAYGGFNLPEELEAKLSNYEYDDPNELGGRVNPILIDWVLAHKGETELKVVEMPDDATDFYIEEYDGWESLLYVRGGKIYWAYEV